MCPGDSNATGNTHCAAKRAGNSSLYLTDHVLPLVSLAYYLLTFLTITTSDQGEWKTVTLNKPSKTITDNTNCKMDTSYLERFPGEIRNNIYKCCIDIALQSAKVKVKRFGKFEYVDTQGQHWVRHMVIVKSAKEDIKHQFEVQVVSQWNRRPVIRFTGLASLPLLSVNKKVYAELSSLIYAKVGDVSVGGYILEHPSEDPSSRWKGAHSLLQKQPGLLKFMKSISIRLPSMRGELEVGRLRSLGLTPPSLNPVSSNAITRVWARFVPDLLEFLLRFEALSTIRIIIPVEKQPPPNFNTLCQL
jgi:hypothetical protein